MTRIINIKLKQLQEAREKADYNRSRLNAMIDHVKADSMYTLHMVGLTQATEEITRLENEIKEDALKEYQKNKEKHLVNGAVNIIDRISMAYPVETALEWCKKNLTPAVIPETLDTKVFEKLAKDVKPEFVTITKIPQAQIAQDLSKFDLSIEKDSTLPGPITDKEIPF